MAHYLIFTKVVTLTLPLIRFSKKKLPIVLGPEDDRTSGVVCTSRSDGQTDRQTDRQADRGDQYTLRKSEISQSNKHTEIA